MGIYLLDCTLRDGGHQNKSRFGESVIADIIRGMSCSNIEYMELGFLREKNLGVDYSAENSIGAFVDRFPIVSQNENVTYTIMIQEDQYDIDKLPICDGVLKDIRVSFHDYDQKEGLEYCRQVIKKGYRCYVNPINITGYDDEQVLSLVREVNDMKASAFTLVDTFGSLTKDDMQRLFMLVNHNLDNGIAMGIHLHDNLQMAYALAQTVVEMATSDRDIIIDASLLGMGREPGNLCIELIMEYLNHKIGKKYNVDIALDLIDKYISELKSRYPWGYETSYALSAQYKLHRSYAEYLMKKQKLKTKQIRQILGMIPQEKRSRYDEQYIENLYKEIVAVDIDDSEFLTQFKQVLEGRTVLLVAPGHSLNEYQDEILKFCKDRMPMIICANFVCDFLDTDYVFCSNAKRLDNLEGAVSKERLILSEALRVAELEQANYVNTNRLGWFGNEFWDNCMLMLLHLMKDIEIKEVFLVGWDGFSNKANFAKPCMESIYQYENENKRVTKILKSYFSSMKLEFITPSLYIDEIGGNNYDSV